MDRAAVFETVGREFEPPQARHTKSTIFNSPRDFEDSRCTPVAVCNAHTFPLSLERRIQGDKGCLEAAQGEILLHSTKSGRNPCVERLAEFLNPAYRLMVQNVEVWRTLMGKLPQKVILSATKLLQFYAQLSTTQSFGTY
jgi:hypothetical protein